MKHEEELRHPSFGSISIHRLNGNSGYLFGSNVQPDNFIEIELREACMVTDLTDERISEAGGRPLFSVKMSPAQFAEFITSANYCPGVACTITQMNGKDVPQVSVDEVENRKAFVQRKFRERMREFYAKIEESQNKAFSKLEKGNLTKAERMELIDELKAIRTEINSNIPYFASCFQETMDHIIVDAKCEIDAAIQHKVTVAGLEALASKANLLEK